MKRILVPTDFSDCAGYAADAAVHMAEQHGAEVIFYTRIPGDQADDFMEAADVHALPMSIAGKFETLLEPYAKAGTVIRMMYSSKDLVPGVLELADKLDTALIVMGSSGAGGLKELVWGSNAQRMVNQSHDP
ncbi:MAG: universal stress protein [Bacteroidia bacterium]